MGANLFTTGVTALANNDLMEQDRGERQQFAWEQMSAAQNYNTTEAQKARDFNERMANTYFQRQGADLTAAGLNPVLGYMRGGTPGTPTSPAPQSPTPAAAGGTPFSPINNGFTSAAEGAALLKQAELLDAQKEKTKAETDQVRGTTPQAAVNIEATKQSIQESKTRIDKLLAETDLTYTTAANVEQQTTNLRATLVQIHTTVDQLRAITANTQEATRQLVRQGKLTEAEAAKVIQQIAANMPEIDRRSRELDVKEKLLDMPRRGNETAVHNSILGGAAALWKVVNPLAGLIAIGK